MYKGSSLLFTFFTIVCHLYLLMGFRSKRIYFDLYLGVFFYLGFWAKFCYTYIVQRGLQDDWVGFFSFTPEAFDKALLVSSVGISALILTSFLRSSFFFSYQTLLQKNTLQGLYHFYSLHKKKVWLAFIGSVLFFSFTNLWYGIYQRGVVSRTLLPFGGKGLYTWFFLIGGGTLTALILEFELRKTRKLSLLSLTLMLFESFMSSTSMLSRGMIINSTSLSIGYLDQLRKIRIKLNLTKGLFFTFCFMSFFGTSIYIVQSLRFYQTLKDPLPLPQLIKTKLIVNKTKKNLKKEPLVTAMNTEVESAPPSRATNPIKAISAIFFLRWIGIDGAMTVSSYPELGPKLWKEAWAEKNLGVGSSLYDHKLRKSAVQGKKHHFITMPGVLGFCYYLGSYWWLFILMSLVGITGALFEYAMIKVVGPNLVLCSLLSQVVATRFVHFGYSPIQSYKLFGSLIFTLFLIYTCNKILAGSFFPLKTLRRKPYANC